MLPRCWLPRKSWRLEHNQCHGPFHFCCSSPSTSRSPENVSCLLQHSCPESRDNPQCANGSKHEARSEYELEIEHASFQNRHNILLSLSGPPIVARLPKATRRTIGHGQNTSRMPRLRPFWSVTADVLLRQGPGEEDEEEDEGDGKEDDDKDDGYSE